MNFQLTEEQKAVQMAARDFAMNELLPGVIERDEYQKLPVEQIKKLGKLGFLGMMMYPEYGGYCYENSSDNPILHSPQNWTSHDTFSEVTSYPKNLLRGSSSNSLGIGVTTRTNALTDPKSLPDNNNGRKRVFVSFAFRDMQYLDRLKVHLSTVEDEANMYLWDATSLRPGQKWNEEIQEALHECTIAILMVSADFLASKYIKEKELPPLLKAAEDKGKTILPLILKPCRYLDNPGLAQFQSINPPDKPISSLSHNNKEREYMKVAQVVSRLIN